MVSDSAAQTLETLRFVVKPNSFFTILVFNDLLRAAESGLDRAYPAKHGRSSSALDASLSQLAIEKMDWGAAFDIVVRDGKTGFVFFNIEGNLYDYDANAQLLSITGGRLLLSQEFANALGRPSDAGSVVGKISIGAAMQPIEVTQLVNGEAKSVVMPPLQGQPAGKRRPWCRAPMSSWESCTDWRSSGAPEPRSASRSEPIPATTATRLFNWFALPDNDHPTIPQNLYRMSGGATNNDRFEQIGQSSVKHAFTALDKQRLRFWLQRAAVDGHVILAPDVRTLIPPV